MNLGRRLAVALHRHRRLPAPPHLRVQRAAPHHHLRRHPPTLRAAPHRLNRPLHSPAPANFIGLRLLEKFRYARRSQEHYFWDN